MYGDFSRILDQRLGAYSGVLAEQGRSLVDAELNEHQAILLDYLRRLATDLVGPFAAPARRPGFKVTPVTDGGGTCSAVALDPGRLYVNGLRADAPGSPGGTSTRHSADPPRAAPFVVYLRVWEQAISAVQAPDLLDPALAFAASDTTRRSQVRWSPELATELPGTQVNLTTQDPDEIVRAFIHHNAGRRDRPRLAARAAFSSDPEEPPMTSPPPAAYRGEENQLYRIEIHQPGRGREASFKWSRENGSVEFGLSQQAGQSAPFSATVTNSWRDPRATLIEGQWVEFVDDAWSPFGAPGPLLQVQTVSGTPGQVTLAVPDLGTPPAITFDPDKHPLLRRWDQAADSPSRGIPVAEATDAWFELESGIQVKFESGTSRYERGDYWVVPARTAVRGVLWPVTGGRAAAVPSQDPSRHLAPLALVRSLSPLQVVDLRTILTPAAESCGADPADEGRPPVRGRS